MEIDSRRAWSQVLACFMSTFAVYGVNYSFGAAFKAMATDFDASRAAASLVFGITTSASFLLGLATGALADRYGPRPVLLVGAVCQGVGLWLTSHVDSIQLGYLTFGVGMGIAIATAYVPMVAVVSGWFVRQRAIAVGVAVAGIGAGNLVMNPVSARMIESLGWRETYRIFAVVGSAVLVLAAIITRRPPIVGAPIQSGVAIRRAVANPTFRWLYLSLILMSFALFVPFVHLTNYAKERGVEASRAALLVGLIGAASIVGRIVFGALGGRMSSLVVYQAAVGTMAASLLIWLAAGNRYVLMATFTLTFGAAYGAFIALAPTVAAERFGTAGLGAVIGALYTGAGVGSLAGPPIAGWLIDRNGYRSAITFAVVLAALSFVCLLPLRTTSVTITSTP